MPLHKPNELKQLFLPTSKDLPESEKEWVTIETGAILGGDLMGVAGTANNAEVTINIMFNRIKEWNVRETSGEAAVLNVDNLRRLDVTDLAYLLTEFIGDTEAATSTDPKVTTIEIAENS